jgi:hypothetical protein
MEQFQNGLGEAWASIATFIPQFVAFILILVIGLFIAKAVAKALSKVLERVGFDRMVERGGVKRALDRSEYDASDLLAKVVYYVVALFVLQLAFGIFGPNPISELLTGVIGYLPRIFVAILIVVIGSAIAAAAKDLIEAALGGVSSGKTLANVAAGAILVIAGFAALNQLQIAPEIVNGLFYALLAIVVGASVVAFGGGGIPVARRYVERWAQRADEEQEKLSAASEGAEDRVEARAKQRRAQAQGELDGAQGEGASATRELDLREAEAAQRRR